MAKNIIVAALFLIAAFVAVIAEASFALPPLPAGVLEEANGQSPAIFHDKKFTFKVCGQFCGPSWCAGSVLSEDQCVRSGKWSRVSPDSKVDSCCKTHDKCCGDGNRGVCNTQIVQCIQANKAYWSICGAAVWAAMKTVSSWCCGSRCPTYVNPDVLLTLAGKVFADDRVRITFAEDSTYTVEAVLPAAEGGLRLAAEADASVCAPQPYSFGADTLQLHLGAMMHIDTNACGKKLMTATPLHEVHPLLDSPDTVLYWPEADVIAVNDKVGGVLQIPRLH